MWTQKMATCGKELIQNHTCHREFDWNYVQGDLNKLHDSLKKKDPQAKLCYIDAKATARSPMTGMSVDDFYIDKFSVAYYSGQCKKDDMSALVRGFDTACCKALSCITCNVT